VVADGKALFRVRIIDYVKIEIYARANGKFNVVQYARIQERKNRFCKVKSGFADSREEAWKLAQDFAIQVFATQANPYLEMIFESLGTEFETVWDANREILYAD